MSLFAGIYSLDEKTSPDARAVEGMRTALARSNVPLRTYEDSRLFVGKADLGLFDESAFTLAPFIAAATAEPLLSPRGGHVNNREEDLMAISRSLQSGDSPILRKCHGSFSIFHYDPSTTKLSLGTDRLGVRPVYFHVGSAYLYFASCLRILESLPAVPKQVDLRGVTETAFLGYPLGDRTCYRDIKVLRGGEVLTCQGKQNQISRYWRWADSSLRITDYATALDSIHEAFTCAVECRSARERSAMSLLSGGLDSRAIVGALYGLGKQVHAVTLTYPGSKDALFASKVSRCLNIRHTKRAFEPKGRPELQMANVANSVKFPAGEGQRFPSLVFSGDGGSVGVGVVYLTRQIVSYMRQGRTREAAEQFLAASVISRRAVRKDRFDLLYNIAVQGVLEELQRVRSGDPAKDFHAFLMDNDQRRHTHFLSEDLDRRRVEFLLPFFDGRLLELISACPVDWFLHHAFYHDWLRKFPPEVTEVPWQTYPGHQPCPISTQELGYRDQWERTRSEQFDAVSNEFWESGRYLLGARFPSSILVRRQMLLAWIIHGLRIRFCGHIWESFLPLMRYYARSQGNIDGSDLAWVLPASGGAKQNLVLE